MASAPLSARGILLLVGGLALRHREIARVGGVVARQRCEIAGICDRVTLVGRVQTRLGGLPALAGGALADVTAELVRARIDAGREVAVAGGLIAVGGPLVAVGAHLIGVRQGLVAVGKRLLALGARLPRAAGAMWQHGRCRLAVVVGVAGPGACGP
jgi:hypothetical protein